MESRKTYLKDRIRHLSRKAAKCSLETQHDILSEITACIQGLDAVKIPVSPIVDTSTMYAFIKGMYDRNGVIAALGAEGSIVPCFNAVSSDLLQPVLKAWNLERISSISKKHGEISVEFPRLHIATAWQASEARKILIADKYVNIGLSSRFLYYEVRPGLIREKGNCLLSREAESWWSEVVLRQVDFHVKHAGNHADVLQLSAEAQNYLKLCRQKWVSRSVVSADFERLLHKCESHAVRIAIAIHCIEENVFQNKTISSSVMRRACGLTEFFLEEHERVMSRGRDARIVKLAAEICGIISKGQHSLIYPGLPVTTSYIAVQGGVTQKAVNQAMYWLAERGLVYAVTIPVSNIKSVPGWQPKENLFRYQSEDALMSNAC